jgi:hypothetical protein
MKLKGATSIVLLAGILYCGAVDLTELSADPRTEVVERARSYIGSGYCRGSASPPCFDCSGFVYHLLQRRVEGLPRTSREMARFGKPVSREALQPGDLLFFATTSARGVISHVALYLGQNSIIHAISDGPNRGVHITPVDARYWRNHYHSAARVFLELEEGSRSDGEELPEAQSQAQPQGPEEAEALRFAKGRYTGELRAGEPHGKGRLEFDNGDLYRGEFYRGELHGSGTYIWKSGARYTGEFREGVMEGSGVYISADGRRIEGRWKDGSPVSATSKQEPNRPYTRIHDSPWDEWEGYVRGDFYAWRQEQESEFEAWKSRQEEGY